MISDFSVGMEIQMTSKKNEQHIWSVAQIYAGKL